MTKVTILGDESKQEKKLKPIKFLKYLKFSKIENFDEGEWADSLPNKWDNIILIKRDYKQSGEDLMFATDVDNSHCLFIGHFNDGVV